MDIPDLNHLFKFGTVEAASSFHFLIFKQESSHTTLSFLTSDRLIASPPPGTS
jgi:hypothetical protein